MLQEIESSSKLTTTTWEGYVDWRNKPALINRHGGLVAASFVLGKPFLDHTIHGLDLSFFFL